MKKMMWPAAVSLAGFFAFFALRVAGARFIDERGLTDLLAFCYAFLGLAIVRCCGFLCFDILYFKRTRREAPGVLRIMFSVVAYSIVLMLIIGSVLKYDITGLIATSAVLSVVIGLALQDTLGNFFAGTSLHIEQPFKIKDSIKFRDNTGEVEAVSWRTTTIRTNNDTLLIFPNGVLARDAMEVFPYNRLHRHSVGFPAPYSISPQTVITIVRNAAHCLPDVSYEIEPVVRITGFGDSSINYEVLYWTKDYMKVADTSAKLRERIWYAFYRDNISMPFPTRHVLVERLKPECRSALDADYRVVIEGIDIFEPLTPTAREDLVCSSESRVYAPGEFMVRCGEDGDSMFIIGRGKVEVRVPSNGESTTVAVLETGSFFGEMSLFSGEPRSADVVAIEEVAVLEIRKSSVRRLLIENTNLAEAFSKKVTERHASLKDYASSIQRVEPNVEQERLLQRIKRFFNLS